MEEPISRETKPLNTLLIISESLKILIKNLEILLPISLITILPLSLLIFAFSLDSQHLRAQISAKEALYTRVPTSFEARHVRNELIWDYLDLLKLQSLYFLPSYSFSLIATITAVSSVAVALNGKSPTYLTALTAVQRSWKGALVTSLYVFFLRSAYDHFARAVCVASALARAKWVFAFCPILEGFEFYLTAVLSLAMVVSVLEERFGWEALGASWEMIAGKRFSGWILSGFQVLLSGGIGWAFSVVVGRQNVITWSGVLDSVLLVCSFSLLVLFSYVVNTVFYHECMRQYSKTGTRMPTVELVYISFFPSWSL